MKAPTYRALIHHIGDKDPTTRRLLEDILRRKKIMLMNLQNGTSVNNCMTSRMFCRIHAGFLLMVFGFPAGFSS